jgi:hypothetical protein
MATRVPRGPSEEDEQHDGVEGMKPERAWEGKSRRRPTYGSPQPLRGACRADRSAHTTTAEPRTRRSYDNFDITLAVLPRKILVRANLVFHALVLAEEP